jgi:hypothetical protein
MSRTSRTRICARCDEEYSEPYPWPYPWPKMYCSASCHNRNTTSAPKAARKPVAAASKEQAAKRNGGASVVSGATRGLDAAHLTPRPLGGCEHKDCVVPLTREEHRAFDEGRLDLLPYLVADNRHAEIAHALEHYRCDLPALLERLTGTTWYPSDQREAA